MAVVGAYDPWATTFPDGLVPIILSLVLTTWAGMEKPAREEHETAITRALRTVLRQNKNATYALPCTIDRESVEDDPDTGEEKGRIDIRFIHGHVEEVYFAFECKRLNAPTPHGRRSLAVEYVTEGMMRFVTGKYGAGLEEGGMIGYVMDGATASAISKVDAKVRAELRSLKMKGGTGLGTSTLLPTNDLARETKHLKRAPQLTLHHLFLPV